MSRSDAPATITSTTTTGGGGSTVADPTVNPTDDGDGDDGVPPLLDESIFEDCLQWLDEPSRTNEEEEEGQEGDRDDDNAAAEKKVNTFRLLERYRRVLLGNGVTIMILDILSWGIMLYTRVVDTSTAQNDASIVASALLMILAVLNGFSVTNLSFKRAAFAVSLINPCMGLGGGTWEHAVAAEIDEFHHRKNKKRFWCVPRTALGLSVGCICLIPQLIVLAEQDRIVKEMTHFDPRRYHERHVLYILIGSVICSFLSQSISVSNLFWLRKVSRLIVELVEEGYFSVERVASHSMCGIDSCFGRKVEGNLYFLPQRPTGGAGGQAAETVLRVPEVVATSQHFDTALVAQQQKQRSLSSPKTGSELPSDGRPWVEDSATGYFWSETEQLFFDRVSGHFYDLKSEQWYNPTTQEWYKAE